jgi:hypothetical protein
LAWLVGSNHCDPRYLDVFIEGANPTACGMATGALAVEEQ